MSDYAFPEHPFEAVKQGDVTYYNVTNSGLTKREYFAALAMQGMLSNPQVTIWGKHEAIVQMSLICADALIKVLDANKEGSEG